MSKPSFPKDLIGFYLPRVAVNWDGLVPDPKTGELVKEASMTKQSFKEECDINNIVRKFEAGGHVDHINQNRGYFDDLPSGLDLQGALDHIHQAETAFMSLPAAVRAQFDNDPVKFVDAFNDPTPEFEEQLVKLGLATDSRPKEEKPVEVKPAEPPKKD